MPDPQLHDLHQQIKEMGFWHMLWYSPLALVTLFLRGFREKIWDIAKRFIKGELLERRKEVFTKDEFTEFDARNTREHGELKNDVRIVLDEHSRILHAAVMDMSDTAKEIRLSSEKLAMDIRETMRLQELTNKEDRNVVHDRITKNEKDIARVEGRLDGMREAG